VKPGQRRAAHGTRELSQRIRIVGGRFKRSILPVPDQPGLRPTPQRVRETLFNWLGQDLTGWRCLDAFAGTGALGFEAASRGAAAVLLIEREPALVSALRASQVRLQAASVTIERGDAVSWMRAYSGAAFDLVLLDPPFDQPALLSAAVEAATHLLGTGSFLYIESARAVDALPAGFERWRSDRAGAVCFELLRRNSSG
jgi:16S rRNA (guanine(966)-N(2))-methyltransferase RsmD